MLWSLDRMWSRSFAREWGTRGRVCRAQVYRMKAGLAGVDGYTGQWAVRLERSARSCCGCPECQVEYGLDL